MALLGVNVDHVATIRQARGTKYPDPVDAALLAIEGGADQITIHLREDRRHIQDSDLRRMKNRVGVPLNLEMAAADAIVDIACTIGPKVATLVPEKRQELTTEGGLDVVSLTGRLAKVVTTLKSCGIIVSMFIEPDIEQVKASKSVGAASVEFHTGRYCDASDEGARRMELERLKGAAKFANDASLRVCAGHGLNYENTRGVVIALPMVVEYNIGHSIVARALSVGMAKATAEMKALVS
jgi:pyridoxine 5-phosphate synthase